MSEQDVNNFSSSPHRLPTISASQALRDTVSSTKTLVSTGLRRLDRILQGRSLDPTDEDQTVGGLPCGQITEIYGPPGVGKTILSLQAAANALLAGGSVVWIDTSCNVSGSRLKHLLENSPQAGKHSTPGQEPRVSAADMLDKFYHFIAPTLPHLIALLAHSTATFPPAGVSLLIVDSISTPFNQAFASSNKYNEDKPSGKKSDVAQWASGRRWAVMTDLISAIAKLAATRNMSVILTSQTTTKMRLGNTALLQPALSGTRWDSGMSSRILLYRDWQVESSDGSKEERNVAAPDPRFAAVTKTGGVSLEGFGEIVSFAIDKDGVHKIEIASAALGVPEPAVPVGAVLKRKREEVADSASDSGEELSDDELSWVADGATVES
ncbi:MAG: hypothetical protein L6R38_006588 [Xanthoria sp. 2 TBL-2021]|nr:MAG: hypothetical protein L6R38_006588 [Xanthoria sp. 2 TBL-2021]